MDNRHYKEGKGPGQNSSWGYIKQLEDKHGQNTKIQPKITTLLKKAGNEQTQTFKKVDLNKVKFKQLNNNKRELSMDEIN